MNKNIIAFAYFSDQDQRLVCCGVGYLCQKSFQGQGFMLPTSQECLWNARGLDPGQMIGLLDYVS